MAEEIPFIDVNPLDEPVNEKRYAQPNINTTGIDMNKPIDEPSFTPPPFRKSEPKSPGSSSGSSSSKQQSKEDPLNPEMSNLNKKDTKMAATAAADMLLSGYETLHVFANKALQIPQKKLKKMEADGLINLNAMIEYDYNHTITAGEFINNYNEQVSNLLTVSDEFKDEVRPLLVEAFQKRGIGLTLEQRIMFCFVRDIASKAIIVYQQKQQVKQMMIVIQEASLRSVPTPPTPNTAPTPTPEPEKEVVVVEPEEFAIDNKSLEAPKKKKPKRYE